jgi:hypothetical protein
MLLSEGQMSDYKGAALMLCARPTVRARTAHSAVAEWPFCDPVPDERRTST